MRAATRRQVIGIGGLLTIAGVAALLFSPRALLESLEALAARPLLFAPALVGLYLLRPFLLWPVTSIAVLLGYLYGPAAGLGLALAGAALTAMPPYLLGRYVQSDFGLFGYVGSTGDQFFDTVGHTRGVIAARFSPIPGDPISYTSGLSGVPIAPFLTGTVLGEVPWAFVAVIGGASMRTLRLSAFSVTPELLVGLAGLSALILAGPLYRRVASESTEL
ncbi:MAG: VTT domain-containing protein [Halovenus sp.]